MGKEENDLTQEILNALLSVGIRAWRQGNQGRKGRRHLVKKGVSDIIGFQKDGTTWWIEAKGPAAKQTEDQGKFQNDFVEWSGNVYILAYKLDDVLAVLKERKLIR